MPPIFIRKTNCPHTGWLSNMGPYKIVVDDIFWKTAEAYFQSLRFASDDAVRETIRIQKSPIAAKKVAKQNVSRMNGVGPLSQRHSALAERDGGRSGLWNVNTLPPSCVQRESPSLSPRSLRAEDPSPTKGTLAERDGSVASSGSEHQKNLRAAQW